MLLTLLTYGLTMRLFDDDRHAFVAALLVAVSPTVIFLTPFLLTDLPATVLVLLGVWLLTFASTNRWLLAGLSFAAATFTRPSSMIYVVVAVGVFALVSMNWKRIAVFIASFGVPVLSWMLIVFAHTGSFAMSTQGTVALMQYGAFYGIVGPQTSKIAKAHAETRMDVVDLVRDAGTEKERIARERAVISERIG